MHRHHVVGCIAAARMFAVGSTWGMSPWKLVDKAQVGCLGNVSPKADWRSLAPQCGWVQCCGCAGWCCRIVLLRSGAVVCTIAVLDWCCCVE